MADIVEKVLQDAADRDAKFKPITVTKPIELSMDEGNLLAEDHNPVDVKAYKAARLRYLENLARDNVQLLVNKIWDLPHERKDDVILAKLPEPQTRLPREKVLPKDKPETRWQAFAKLKGIQNRKRSRMVWDGVKNDWRPRMGFNRANDDTKEWVIEVPEGHDPYEDQFEKRTKAKSERVAKNELHRLRNIARSGKSKVPGVGITPVEKPSKDNLHRALTIAKRSTASVGKFTDSLPKETPAKGMAIKRKFESNIGDFKTEKQRQLEMIRSMGKGKASLNVTKAVNRQMLEQDSEGRGKMGKSGKSFKGKKGGKRPQTGSDKRSLGSAKGGKFGGKTGQMGPKKSGGGSFKGKGKKK